MRTLALLFLLSAFAVTAADKPNIVFILADDLGIGDVHAFNPDGKIPTPRMDAFAAEGVKFVDAHTPSSVCTPTRYGVLTGRYNWRSRLQSGVLGGLSPRLIEPGRLTVAQLLHDQGYATACIGKWHLGLDWVKKEGKEVTELNIEKPEQNDSIDFTKPFANGPLALGFDYYFGIAASLDMVPYTFLENDHCMVVPTTNKKFPMMGDAENKGFTRFGPAAPDFEAMDVLPRVAGRAAQWIEEHAAESKTGKPFFLYLPFNAPHTPSVPTPEWAAKSKLNAYGDYVMEVDAMLGQVLDTLEKSGAAANTLVIFTSDNGCSPMARIEQLRGKGHDPCWGLRGTKADIWEGGHRVPFIVRWPGHTKAGTTSEALVCLTDLMATCAEVTGVTVPENAGEDSVSLLPALRGEAGQRTTLVSHSIAGHFAIRSGNLKLCLTPGSGGWSAPKPGAPAAKNLPPEQLFDLAIDRAETRNLAVEQPEKVKELTALLEKYVSEGRSTPGAPQKNTVPVKIRKGAPVEKDEK